MQQEKYDESVVKNQHYIPVGLLKNFINSDNKIFEALLSVPKIYPSTPEKSMSARFIYEDDHLDLNAVEKYFSNIDSEIAPKVKDVIEAIEKYKKNQVEFSYIQELFEKLLSIFVVFYYRSGALLTEFSSIDSKHKIPLLTKKIHNQRYISLLSQTIKECYKFAIIESDENFLISDQFISTAALKIKTQFANISNRHIGIKETLILIPISSKYYAAYWHSDSSSLLSESGINKLDESQIHEFNAVIINNSYLKCVGQNENDLKKVIDRYKMEFPSQVFIGHRGGGSSGYIRKKEIFFSEKEKEAYEFLIHPSQNINEFLKAKSNDKCPCGKEIKFKKCHRDIVSRIKIPIQSFKQGVDPTAYRMPNVSAVELPIDEWGPYAGN